MLVFGGSFDPPTRAHLALAQEARDRLGIDWLLFVPAARSPLKDSGPLASGADRIAMLVAGLGDEARTGVSTIELDRAAEGASYTVDTLRELRALLGRTVSMRLLIGADQARAFHRWREAREVIDLAEPVVMTRAGVAEEWGGIAPALRDQWEPDELERWRSRLVAVTPVDGSSTEARELLGGGGRHSARLREILTPEVLAVIEQRGLYRGSAE